MTLSEAVRVYEVGGRAEVGRVLVSFDLAKSLSKAVRRLGPATADFPDDEIWTSFSLRARRIAREVASTPLPFSSAAFSLTESHEYLSHLATSAKGHYPDKLVALADVIVIALADLMENPANPLGAATLSVLGASDLANKGVVVHSRHFERVKGWLANEAPGARLLSDRDLSSTIHLETIAVIGPSSWFPSHVVSAPRADSTTFVQFAWIRDRPQSAELFSGSSLTLKAHLEATPEDSSDDWVDATDLAPTVNWEALSAAVGAHAGGHDEADLIDAKLFLLAGGYSVYLEAVEGPRIHVVDLEAEGEYRLRNELTRSVEPGMYIVLRSAGGSGDYIPEIADVYLGARAKRLRSLQQLWKQHLREYIRERGFSAVAAELRAKGVASPNLRYRLWQHSMRSRDPADFKVLMDLIGLGGRAEELWTAMGELFEAHIRAGQQVRRLLEAAVLKADMEQLRQLGRVNVELDEIDAGALSVFLVEAGSPESTKVPEQALRDVREMAPDLWPG
jgi:hypothetical protein